MNVSGSGESLFAAFENEKLITLKKVNIVKEGKVLNFFVMSCDVIWLDMIFHVIAIVVLINNSLKKYGMICNKWIYGTQESSTQHDTINGSLVWISSEWKVWVLGRLVGGLVSCHSWPEGEEKEEEEERGNGKERDEKEDGIDNDMINVEEKWEKEEQKSE
jgi:hypothetical protein